MDHDLINDMVDLLNAYEGDNIWQDVIWNLPIDEEATDQADPSYSSDVIVLTDGSEIRYSGGQWRHSPY